MAITLQTLSFESVRNKPREDKKIAYGSRSNGALLRKESTVYVIAQNDEYYLGYGYEPRTFLLENGTRVNDDGYFIVNKSTKQAVAFWSTDGGIYSEIPNSTKERVVESWNQTISGTQAETTEEVESDFVGASEGPGESQEAREETINGKTISLSFDNTRNQYKVQVDNQYVYFASNLEDAISNYDSKKSQLEGETPLDSEVVIRENNELLTTEGASLRTQLNVELIEVTRGTQSNPSVTYRLENGGSEVGTYGTQLEGETAFDNLVSQLTEQHNATTSQEIIEIAAEQERLTISKSEAEITYSAQWVDWTDNINFREMFTRTGYTLPENVKMNPLSYGSTVLYGPYGDAADFSNGGNTLELDDFDSPRVTTQGITANPSGGVYFKIQPNWRLTFELSSESRTFMRNNAPELVETTSNKFTFTMNSSDVCYIDIDNERPRVYPFLITVNGVEWVSTEEIDDETEIELIKVEYLEMTQTKTIEFLYGDGSRVQDTLRAQIEAGTIGGSVDLISYNDIVSTTTAQPWVYAMKEDDSGPDYTMMVPRWPESLPVLESDPSYMEAGVADRPLSVNMPDAEDSFVAPEDITEDIGDAVGGAVDSVTGGIWDRFKWPIIIGGVVVVGLVVFAIWINSRSRGGVGASSGQ